MDAEQRVAQHYSREGLEQAILAALQASGKDIDKLSASDLSGADEFHLGWLPATIEFGRDLGLSSDMRVLDVGSGIGGPARYFAREHGCHVTGIDLTEELVQVANALTRRCGLSDRAAFVQGSALALPFADKSFDASSLIHVGMNIPDKAKHFSEVRRALRPGGRFGVYDIMRVADAELPYPMRGRPYPRRASWSVPRPTGSS
jgi:SAM-dependent methyltransferase